MANEYLEGLKKYKEGNLVEAIKLWNLASERKSPEAKFMLAREYISGKFLPKNINEAIRLLDESSSLGFLKALITLCDAYEKGLWGIPQNHEKALCYYAQYSQRNGEEALRASKTVAEKYEKIDYSTAIKYYEIAAEQGDLDAKLKVADYYANEPGYDKQKLVRYYRECAAKGMESAIYKMAQIYQKGLYGTAKDYEQYVNTIEELADDYPENVEYQKAIIDIYENGLYGVTKNLDKAYEILEELSENDCNEEIYTYMLAEVFETGRMGQKVDQKKAVAIYSNLLSKYENNQIYQLKMAEIFEDGKFGVGKDLTKATLIYRKLISEFPDNPLYTLKIAKMYYKNSDADNQKLALQNFEKSYACGSIEAGYYLVFMYYDGGTRFPKDFAKSAKIAGEITLKIPDCHEISPEEQKLYQRMKTLEIMMYKDGGAKLPKNPRRAKEIMNEYNALHQDKIKIKL